MTHFALQSYKKAIVYILIFLGIGLTIAAMLFQSVSFVFLSLVLISSMFSLGFAALTIPLWMVVQFVENTKQKAFQTSINVGAVFIVFQTILIAFTVVCGYFIVPKSDWNEFVKIVPILLACGMLGFGFMYQLYRLAKYKKTTLPDEKQIVATFTDEREPQAEIVERISVKHGQKIHVIPVDSIQYLQAEGDYVMIFTKDSKYLKEQTMKYFESHLSQDIFVRIHRSYIVNVHSISNVQLYEKQQYIITLRSGIVIKASAGGYKLLKQKLQL